MMPDLVWADPVAEDASRLRSISIIASIPGRYMLTRRIESYAGIWVMTD
jgi:hypothetical protein